MKFVLVLSPVSPELVFVAVTGGVVVMLVEVVEAACVVELSMAVVVLFVFASVSEPSEVEPDIVVEAEAK